MNVPLYSATPSSCLILGAPPLTTGDSDILKGDVVDVPVAHTPD